MRNDIFFYLRKYNLFINTLFENAKSNKYKIYFFLNYNLFFL